MSAIQPSKYFEVERYSHHFVLKNMSAAGRQIAEKFARLYVQYGLVKVGRQYRRAPVKVFAARISKKNEIRFHIGQWQPWVNYLLDIAVPEHSYIVREYACVEPEPLNAKVNDKRTPFEYQIPIIDYLESPLPTIRKLVEVQTGKGKALCADSFIRVPDGWKRLREIRLGELAIAKDGTEVTISGVYPQGKVQLYVLKFADGRSVRACAEHAWSVSSDGVVETLSTLEVMQRLKDDVSLSIPLPDPERAPNVELPNHPYLLGLTLSAGFDNVLTLIDRIRSDAELVEEFNRKIGQEYVTQVLSGKLSDESWAVYNDDVVRIPQLFMNASYSQRLALLQGIIDADSYGTLDTETNAYTYNAVNELFAKDMQYLVRSIGGIAITDENNVQIVTRNQAGLSLTSLGNPALKECIPDPELSLSITSVRPTRVDDAICISVAHPDQLYITNDFIVTHNTFMAAAAISNIGHRVVAFLKPKYLEKWIADLKELLDIEREDIILVQGSASLMDVIAKGRAGTLKAKAILVSNRTFQYFISGYEENGDSVMDMGYDCLPHEFIQVIGAGVKLVDEVHEDFHLNFKIDLYTHVMKSISLSATLVSDDQFITQMHQVAYPKDQRYSGLEYSKYITSYALRYSIINPDRMRTTEIGSSSYSHMAYEKNFFRNEKLLKAYLELIASRFELRYLKRRTNPEQRCLIYGASIQMCTMITQYLQKKYPDLDIRRYVEKDPYENLMDSQVCISTIGSAGTGHDIPKLITVLLTVSIASKASNIQGFGRLRDLKEMETIFEYFTCKDIPKHMEYYERKELLLATMAKTATTIDLPGTIGA